MGGGGGGGGGGGSCHQCQEVMSFKKTDSGLGQKSSKNTAKKLNAQVMLYCN